MNNIRIYCVPKENEHQHVDSAVLVKQNNNWDL